jgi:hypothetical protein
VAYRSAWWSTTITFPCCASRGQPRLAVGWTHPDLRGRRGRSPLLSFFRLPSAGRDWRLVRLTRNYGEVAGGMSVSSSAPPKASREWRLARPTRTYGNVAGGDFVSLLPLSPLGQPLVAVGQAHPELRGGRGRVFISSSRPPKASREWRLARPTRTYGDLAGGFCASFPPYLQKPAEGGGWLGVPGNTGTSRRARSCSFAAATLADRRVRLALSPGSRGAAPVQGAPSRVAGRGAQLTQPCDESTPQGFSSFHDFTKWLERRLI